MAKDTIYTDAKVICTCGETFMTKSTLKEIQVESCSKCHPAFTGQQQRTAQKGKIEKFNQKYGLKNKNV